MTEVTFQFSRQSDLELMLQLAQRLGIPYSGILPKKKQPKKTKSVLTEREQKLALMSLSAKDPIFLADVEEVTNDFVHADNDEI